MRTYKILLLWICVISFSKIHGQVQDTIAYQVNWTESLKVPYLQEIENFKITNEYLISKSWKMLNEDMSQSLISINKAHLYRVDLNTRQILDKEIKLKNGDQQRNVEQVMYIDDAIHVITSFINTEQKKIYFFDETVDDLNLELKNDTRKICEIDYGTLDKPYLYSLTTFIELKNNKVILKNTIYTKLGEISFYNIFDLKLKSLADYHFVNDKRGMEILDVMIDNKNNMYLVSWLWDKKAKTNQHTINFLPFDKSAAKSQLIEGINIISNLRMAINSNNDLICAGLYSRPQQLGPIGAFSLILPSRLDGVGKLNKTDFSNEVILAGLVESEKIKVGSKLSKNLDYNDNYVSKVDALNIGVKGDYTFVCERSKSFNTSRPNSSLKSYCSEYSDIYVLSCNSDGSFKWQDKISRYQYLYNENELKGHFIPFFDHNNNLSIVYSNLDEELKNAKSAKVCMVQYDTNGKRLNKTLISNSKIASDFSPKYSKFIGEGQILSTLVGWIKNKICYKVGLIKFNNVEQ